MKEQKFETGGAGVGESAPIAPEVETAPETKETVPEVSYDAIGEMLEECKTLEDFDALENKYLNPENPINFYYESDEHKKRTKVPLAQVKDIFDDKKKEILEANNTAENPAPQSEGAEESLAKKIEDINKNVEARKAANEKRKKDAEQKNIPQTEVEVEASSDPIPSAEIIVSNESKELTEENIRAAASLEELSALLKDSNGIESSSTSGQGHFSGLDLEFLIEQVAQGEAYIEEITREKGLREKVWNLILSEKGFEPKSLEREEEKQQKENESVQKPEHVPNIQPMLPPAGIERSDNLMKNDLVPETAKNPSAPAETPSRFKNLLKRFVGYKGGWFGRN